MTTNTPQEWRELLDDIIGRGKLQQAGLDVSRYLHEKILQGGEETRDAADILHGKQLGHPLHPVLTDITIGAWGLGVFFDIVALLTFSRGARKTANHLITLGTLSAIPTAITGIADYSGIKQDAAGYGAAHGMLNGIAFFCFARSTIARFQRRSGTALLFSFLGMTFATLSAWLGGDLVYRHKVGVNHATGEDPGDWTPVLAETDLKEGVLTRVEADEQPILLFRQGEEIHAIDAVCSHAGGPLDQGTIVDDICVECPWHQSVYDLRDGQVVHGPSAFSQPHYLARTRNGQIEVRLDRYDTRLKAPQQPTLYDAPASQPESLMDGNRREAEELPSQAEGEPK